MRSSSHPAGSFVLHAAGMRGSGDSPMAYRALVFLIFVIYVAPQAFFPSLTGLHLAKVSAALAIVAYGAHVITRGVRWTVMTTEVRLIVVLFCIALISIPFSLWPGGSVGFVIDQYSKSIIIFFLVANLLLTMDRYRSFLWTIGAFAGFNALLGIKNYFGGVYRLGRIQGGASGIAGNPNDLALVMNLTLPFLFFLYATARSTSQRIISAALIAINIVAIILTFSRAGFVTLVFLVLWLAWVRGRHQGMGSFWKMFAGLGVILIILNLAGPGGYGSRMATIVDKNTDETGSAQARWNMMVGTAQGMLAHPLGVGVHMNNLLLHDTGLGWNGVHNIYLELGTELGIPGFIVFLYLLHRLLTVMKVIRIRHDPKSELSRLAEAAGGAMVAYAVSGMFYPVAYHFYFYIVAGLIVACQQIALHVEPVEVRHVTHSQRLIHPSWLSPNRL